MPPEVLSEIFFWTLPSPIEPSRHRTLRITDSPWVLTHVSSRWRMAAISDPSLWSLVAISYHSDTDPLTSFPLSMIETQISRAPTMKIHFRGCETTNPRPQLRIFHCLAEHALRWEELDLTVTSALFPLLVNLRGHLPLLRRLCIQWGNRQSQAAADSIDCFESAPSLVDVGVYSEYRYIPVSFPTRQITHYDLDAPWEIHRGILKLTQNLLEASITISFEDTPQWPELRETIELLHLRRLDVSHSHVLTFLKFPVLEEISLDLHNTELQNSATLVDLESSLMYSQCPIRKLGFQGCPDAQRITALLQKFCIAEFTIITATPAASVEAGALMDIFSKEAADGRAAAPHLRQLCFECIYGGSLDYGRYLKMVKYRWEVGGLKSAELHVNSGYAGPDAKVLAGLEALRKEGLEFVFGFPVGLDD
ncbi:hypothetical protein DFH06DRAFT_1247221 [Mycena polygramma]|nr:hypothetical protein DFH06DRAFT_1247221 [Mycena polygramma]